MGSQGSKGVLQNVPVSEHKQQVDDVTCSIAHKRQAGRGASHTIHLLLVFTDRHSHITLCRTLFSLACLSITSMNMHKEQLIVDASNGWTMEQVTHMFLVHSPPIACTRCQVVVFGRSYNGGQCIFRKQMLGMIVMNFC